MKQPPHPVAIKLALSWSAPRIDRGAVRIWISSQEKQRSPPVHASRAFIATIRKVARYGQSRAPFPTIGVRSGLGAVYPDVSGVGPPLIPCMPAGSRWRVFTEVVRKGFIPLDLSR
jgi:hypothetical protein